MRLTTLEMYYQDSREKQQKYITPRFYEKKRNEQDYRSKRDTFCLETLEDTHWHRLEFFQSEFAFLPELDSRAKICSHPAIPLRTTWTLTKGI